MSKLLQIIIWNVELRCIISFFIRVSVRKIVWNLLSLSQTGSRVESIAMGDAPQCIRLVAELKTIFERQNNLRPIFSALFRMNRRERQHASPLRRLLAEAGIEYSELQVSIATPD